MPVKKPTGRKNSRIGDSSARTANPESLIPGTGETGAGPASPDEYAQTAAELAGVKLSDALEEGPRFYESDKQLSKAELEVILSPV